MLDTPQLFKTYAIAPRGVIHVGAHEGKELATYRKLGFKRILFVEANPEVFRRLHARIGGEEGVILANVAVSDRSGTVQLNVTSMDQSSSILPLKTHAEIYPSIRVVNTVEVRALTIDELLSELQLDPADFNYLNLDIQGAELMALRGAARTLQHIEAVNTEVNFAELYAGCALIKQLEEHLAGHGLNRVALARPYHPTWGDGFYVRRPLVAMSTLGRNGRFANQLFQYLFLRLVARQNNAIVHTPPWAGRPIFGLADQDVIRVPAAVHESALEHPERLIEGTERLTGDVDFCGYFQLHSRHFAPHRDFIRELFTPAPKLRAALDAAVKSLRARGRTLVALHLRRGDYGYDHFFRAPAAWYRDWLTSVHPELKDPIVYICSESPREQLPYFTAWKTASFADIQGVPPSLAFLLDFYVLAQADAVAIANSSYSFLAAMLNNHAKRFVRPSLEDRGLVPFSPWDAPVLLRRKLAPGEQQELDELDRPPVAAAV